MLERGFSKPTIILLAKAVEKIFNELPITIRDN